MSHNPTISDVLNSACGPRNQHLVPDARKKVKRRIIKARNDCKEVQWIHWQLKYWCEEKGYELEKELQFAKPRKFRFDFFVKELNCAIEYEGVFGENSRHTNKIGYSKDTEKYSLAATKGILVLRYTAMNYENVLKDLEKLINQKSEH